MSCEYSIALSSQPARFPPSDTDTDVEVDVSIQTTASPVSTRSSSSSVESAAKLSNSSSVSINDFARKLNRRDLCKVDAIAAQQDLKYASVSRKEFEAEETTTMLTDVTRGTVPLLQVHTHLHLDYTNVDVHQFDTIGDAAHEYNTSDAREATKNTAPEKCCHKLLELEEEHLDDAVVGGGGLTGANCTISLQDAHHGHAQDLEETSEINFVVHQSGSTIKYSSERSADSRLLNGFEHKSPAGSDMLEAKAENEAEARYGRSDLPLMLKGSSNESDACRLPGSVSLDDGSARIPPGAEAFQPCCAIACATDSACFASTPTTSAAARLARGEGSDPAGESRGNKKGLICLTRREIAVQMPSDVCNNPHQILAYLNRALSKQQGSGGEAAAATTILILESRRHHLGAFSQTSSRPNSGKCDCDIVSNVPPKGFPVHTQKIEYAVRTTRAIRHSPAESSPLRGSVPINSRVDTRESEPCESNKQSFLSPPKPASFHDQNAFIRQHQDNIGASVRRRRFALEQPPNFRQFEFVPEKLRRIDVAIQTDPELELGVLEARHDKLANDAWIAITRKRNLNTLNLSPGSGKRFARGTGVRREEEEEDQVVPVSVRQSTRPQDLNDISDGQVEEEVDADKSEMFESETSIHVITGRERNRSDEAPCEDIDAENVCEIFERGDRDGINPQHQQAGSVFQWNEEKLPRSKATPQQDSKRVPVPLARPLARPLPRPLPRLKLGLSKRSRPPPLHPIRYSHNPISSKYTRLS